MNRDLFKGFEDIKADKRLLENTKAKMQSKLRANKSVGKRKFPFTFVPLAVCVLVLALIVLVLPFNKNSVLSAKAEDLMMDIKPADIDVSNAITDNFIKSTQGFSIELFKKSTVSGHNSLVSPTSVALALGMAANGADGKTLDAFESVLGKHNPTLDELNKANKAYSQDLTKNPSNKTLDIANSIWFRSDFTPQNDFLQSNADYYGASARKLDFNNPEAVNTINNWVRESTNNKIDQIVDKIQPDDVMYLLNTMYFKAKWQMPFDTTAKATKSDFSLENGSSVSATFMHLEGSIGYVKDSNASVIVLPYDGGQYGFVGILPDKGIKMDDYIKNLGENTISRLMSEIKPTDMALTMPAFKTSSNNDLEKALKSMGLGIAFDPSKADFSKMGHTSNELYVSAIQSKAYFNCDELGTEAGAATKVVISKQVLAQVVNFNRPFVYAVINTQTNLPIFLGSMENPNA